MNKIFKAKKGFSLLELLVVISIIGILISISIVAFTTAQKKSRDARRRGDVKAMQNAFEQYYSENSAYATCSTMWVGNPGSLPIDPKSTSSLPSYNTGSGCDVTSYCVCAALDGTGDGNASVAPSGTSCTYGTGDYYCLTNLQ